MARKYKRPNANDAVPQAGATDSEYDDDSDMPQYLETYWFPVRDQKIKHILESASSLSTEVSRVLHKTVERGTAGERFAVITSCLAKMLTSRKRCVRRAAARLLDDAFLPVKTAVLPVPKELDLLVPMILSALTAQDSKMRLSLLRLLRRASVRWRSAILSPFTEYLFTDSASEVVIQALADVMETGIDLASVAIPAITELLGHHDTQVQMSACKALANFDTEAGQAVPQLVKIANSENISALRESAILALVAIDPEGRKVSEELTHQPDREAFISHLRAVGVEARDLRVQLRVRWDAEAALQAKEPSEDQSCVHSDDFRSVTWYGKLYKFNANQAACVKILLDHWKRGVPSVSGDMLLEELELNSSCLSQVFRKHPAWGTMIISEKKNRGAYRLNPPFGF